MSRKIRDTETIYCADGGEIFAHVGNGPASECRSLKLLKEPEFMYPQLREL